MVRLLRPPRGRALTALLLGLLVALYAWTALTSADPGFGEARTDPSNRQADAFRHGQLHLRTPVPPAVRALEDPYDPRQALPVLPADIRDLTLYRDRLYTYWGPVPALLAFLPFQVLGLGDLPPAFALLAFALAALLLQAAILGRLTARYAPEAPGWLRAAALAVVAVGGGLPFLLRSPQTYQVAIGAGVCFASATVYLLTRAALRPGGPRRGQLLGAGLCAGLAFGSRPPMGIVLVLGLAIVWVLHRGGRLGETPRAGLARAAGLLLAPFALCVAGIGVYNAMRFGSPAEFGLRYTLTGFDIRGKLGHAGFLGPGLWYYLLQPIRPRVEFPFLWLGPPPYYPWSVPAAYEAPERVAGVLWTLPLLALLAAVPTVLRRRARPAAALLAVAVACGAVLMAFEAAYQPVATQRYEADFLAYLVPATALAWLLATALASGRARRTLAWGGGVLAAWTILVGLAISLVGYDNPLRIHHRGTWNALRSVTSPIATATATLAGRPMVAAVDGDPVSPRPWRLASLDLDGAGFGIDASGAAIDVIAPRAMRARLTATLAPGRDAPAGIPLRLRVADGGELPVRGAATEVLVTLRRGRNELRLTPLARVDLGGSDVVAVSDLRLRDAAG